VNDVLPFFFAIPDEIFTFYLKAEGAMALDGFDPA